MSGVKLVLVKLTKTYHLLHDRAGSTTTTTYHPSIAFRLVATK